MEREEYIADEQVVKRANEAVKLALYKKKVTETPIYAYDRKTQIIYRVKNDGTREVMCSRKTVGRYSERCKEQ